MKTRREAETIGRHWLKNMKPAGKWRLDVWDNLGWHVALCTDYIRVHYDEREKTFTAMVGSCPDNIGDSWQYALQCGPRPRSRDPNRAVTLRLKQIAQGVNQKAETLRKIIAHVKTNTKQMEVQDVRV